MRSRTNAWRRPVSLLVPGAEVSTAAGIDNAEEAADGWEGADAAPNWKDTPAFSSVPAVLAMPAVAPSAALAADAGGNRPKATVVANLLSPAPGLSPRSVDPSALASAALSCGAAWAALNCSCGSNNFAAVPAQKLFPLRCSLKRHITESGSSRLPCSPGSQSSSSLAPTPASRGRSGHTGAGKLWCGLRLCLRCSATGRLLLGLEGFGRPQRN